MGPIAMTAAGRRCQTATAHGHHHRHARCTSGSRLTSSAWGRSSPCSLGGGRTVEGCCCASRRGRKSMCRRISSSSEEVEAPLDLVLERKPRRYPREAAASLPHVGHRGGGGGRSLRSPSWIFYHTAGSPRTVHRWGGSSRPRRE
jgi:hypothetical protein